MLVDVVNKTHEKAQMAEHTAVVYPEGLAKTTAGLEQLLYDLRAEVT